MKMPPTDPQNVIGGTFISEMQNTLRLQEARQQSAQAATIRDAHVRETVGPAQWRTLKTLVIDALERINAGLANTALAYQEEDGHQFAIANQMNGRAIITVFDPAACEISYRGGTGSGKFSARVVGNTLAFWWQNTEPCQGMKQRFRFTDEIGIDEMAELIIRCVVAVAEEGE